MRWKGRRRSSNVKDARRQRVPGRGRGIGRGIGRGVGRGRPGGGLVTLINLVVRTFGLKGILILVALGFIGVQLGLFNPAALLGGDTVQQADYQPSPEEEQLYGFVEVVLADTEDVWRQNFARLGRVYEEPTLVIYRDRHPTACGMGDARMGPFYCPADKTIYIDLSFYTDLAQQFDAPGDFAQAYVIAHEIGHHVQNLLGTLQRVAARRGQPDYNQYSVRLELQADYLAGVWARQNQRYLDAGDIDEALRAANQIGDDAMQRRARGRVVPHAFTHGTSEQRMRWFRKGFSIGEIEGGDTFQMPYDAL